MIFLIKHCYYWFRWWLIVLSAGVLVRLGARTSAGLLVTLFHVSFSLQWRHNERVGVSNHQPHDCLLNRLFRRRSKITSKLRVTGLCAGNALVIGEFPAKRASNAEYVSILWRHRVWRRMTFSYVEAWTKWLQFCGQHFHIHFREWKL